MSTANVDTADMGLALLDEQRRYLEAGAQGARWADIAHLMQVRIDGALDVARLQRVLDGLPARHAALAVRFAEVPGYRGQRQHFAEAPATVALEVQDSLADAAQAQARLQQWAQRPAGDMAGRALQGLLQRTGEQQWQLTLGVSAQVADQASLAILYSDLLAAYPTGACAVDEDLGQFAQYLEWRAEVILDEDASNGRDYWQTHLANAAPSAPQLPERRAVPAGEGTVARCVLVPSAAQREQWVSLGDGAAALLQTAWWALLSRISGREGMLVGWRHDARRDYEFFADTVGLLEKTLPLHLQLPAEQPFAQVLAQLRSTLEQHATWQEYGAAEVFGNAAAPTFTFGQRPALIEQDSAGLRWSAQYLAAQQPQVELALVCEQDPRGNPLRLVLEYDTRRHDEAAIAVLIEQYQVMLDGLAQNTPTPLARLNLLGAVERARLLAVNPAPQALADARLLPARIAHWASTTPEAVALEADGQALSYAQLQAQAGQRAATFAQHGLAAGGIVALALPRGAALLTSLLAAWHLGAGYLPLDPSWPLERQLQLATQAGAALLVAEGERVVALSGQGVDVLDSQALPAGEPVPGVDVQPGDVAYVLFTSGSTGTPKAVVVEHGQLLNYVAGASAALDLAACRQFAFSATVAADLGNTSLFGALYHGATLQVADDATLQDPERFARFIAQQHIDCLKIVPSHLAALLEASAPRLPGTLLLGGEAIAASLLQRIAELRADCRVFNHYGPSETTVGVMVRALDPSDLQRTAIGLDQVLANNQVYVLDAQQGLAVTGELGELYIGGAQLSRGYLDADELTAAAFVELPWLPGQRLYRSGDLARYRAEGGIALYGRRDHQVKVRGFRVELAEIEQQLLSGADVSEAVVLLVQGELRAFVLPRKDAPSDWLDQLKASTERRLPAAMLPQRYQVLGHMPRLANGKVDRLALQALEVAPETQAMVEPRDALEALLMTRMAQLIGLERISVEQDFFAAGGHSLLVIKLVAGIRKLLQCEVHPGIVFDNPSPAMLAVALRGQEAAPGQLDKLAQARLRLDAMSPEEKAQLMAKARQQQVM
ncbi:Tyrocidine synthase 3 [compost metagenome]